MTVCKPQKVTPQPEPEKLPGSVIAARVSKFFDDLSSRTGVISTANQVELRMIEETTILAASASHIPALKAHNPIESWLSKALGWKAWLWQAPTLGMTDAGAVRYALQDRAKIASNLIESLAIFKSLPEIRKVYSELKQALPDMPEYKLQEILYDQIVVGMTPKLLNTVDSPIARDQLYRRYTEHVIRLQELGVVQEAREAMDNAAQTISVNFDMIRKVAGDSGLDIDVITNSGYFPIQAQTELKKLISKATESVPLGKTSMGADLAEHIRQSRVSNKAIVIRPIKFAEMINMEYSEFLNLMSIPGKLTETLNKLPPATLEHMLELGVLSEMAPMSDELTQFFNEAMDLPVANLAEAIVTDPVRAMNDYAEQLKTAVYNSQLVKTLLTDGISNKWLVTEADIPEALKKSYIRLGNSATLSEMISSTNLQDDISKLWIHKTVAEQMQSLIKINQSWADLGAVGAFVAPVMKYLSTFRKSAILATGGLPYLSRVMVQNIVALHAATGSLAQLPLANAQVWRMYFGKGGLEALDNTKVFATIGDKTFTERELFMAGLLKRGSNAVTGSVESVSKLNTDVFKKLNKESLQRFWKFADIYNQRYGNPFTGKVQTAAEFALDLTGNAFDGVYNQLAHWNQLFDYSARWAAIRELSTDKVRKFSSIDELMRATDDYFGIQEDVGDLGRVWGAIGQPFASFALAAPGSALRYTLQHPWRASRVALMYAHSTAGNDLTDAEMSQWQKDQYMLTLYKDPATGKQYAITPSSVDFYRSSFDWASELTERIARTFGAEVGSVEEQVKAKVNPGEDIRRTFTELAQGTYLGAVLPPLLGLDPDTLDKYRNPDEVDTLLGVPMPRMVRDTLTAALPLVRSLDRYLPEPFVGKRPTYDSISGTQKEPGKPGWLGRVPSSAGNKETIYDKPIDDMAMQWFLSKGSGLTLNEIDPSANIFKNYRSFNEIESVLTSRIQSATKKLALEKLMSPGERERITLERNDASRLRFIASYQKTLIDNLARKKGIPTPAAMERMRSMSGSMYQFPTELDIGMFIKDYQNKYKDDF